jgi:hypothetical protein
MANLDSNRIDRIVIGSKLYGMGHDDWQVEHIGRETTGNVHVLAYRRVVDHSTGYDYLQYAVFGTNGRAEPGAQIYLNFTTPDANQAVNHYSKMVGMS